MNKRIHREMNFDSRKLSFFSEMKTLPFEKGYVMNQVNCILSLDRNRQSDYRNVSELFTTYNKILENNSSDQFKKSLEISKSSFVEQCKGNSYIHKKEIESLEENNPKSFLIVPLVSENHLFCSVIRKDDAGYSVTLVNASKGGRRGDDRGRHVGYEEYMFKKDNIDKLATALERTKHGYGFGLKLSNSEIYEMFEAFSDNKFQLNIVSRDQKDGNCYVKEPEKAIKYALYTSNFSQQMFEKLRNPKSPVLTPKWPIPTEEVHRKYVGQLIEENPERAQKLSEKLDAHLKYKNFGKDESYSKLLINGRSLEKRREILFEDNLANLKASATRVETNSWDYYDAQKNLIGRCEKNDNDIKFYDSNANLIATGKKDAIGEKYYDTKNKMIGATRFFYGMQDYNGEIGREHKGQHPVDVMIQLNLEKGNNRGLSNLYTRQMMDSRSKDPNARLLLKFMQQKPRNNNRHTMLTF